MPVSIRLYPAKQHSIELTSGVFRQKKQGCNGKLPCALCANFGRSCAYVPTAEQLKSLARKAERQAARDAGVTPRTIQRRHRAPVKTRRAKLPPRPILPDLEGTEAGFGGAPAQAIYPGDLGGNGQAFGGSVGRPNDFGQYGQGLHWHSGDLDARPNGYLQNPQEPRPNLEWLDPSLHGLPFYPQQPNLAFGGYQPPWNTQPPVLEQPAMMDFTGPPAGSDWFPTLGNESQRRLGLLNDSVQTSPGYGQNPEDPYQPDSVSRAFQPPVDEPLPFLDQVESEIRGPFAMSDGIWRYTGEPTEPLAGQTDGYDDFPPLQDQP